MTHAPLIARPGLPGSSTLNTAGIGRNLSHRAAKRVEFGAVAACLCRVGKSGKNVLVRMVSYADHSDEHRKRAPVSRLRPTAKALLAASAAEVCAIEQAGENLDIPEPSLTP
jgi:transcription elongation GreA/GreB family factor